MSNRTSRATGMEFKTKNFTIMKARHIDMTGKRIVVRTVEQANDLSLPSGFWNVFTDFDFKASRYRNALRVESRSFS